MTYHTIFDVCAAGYRNWRGSVETLSFALLAAAGLLLTLRKRRTVPLRVFLFVVIAASVSTAFSSFRNTHARYNKMCRALHENTYSQVDGEVLRFTPAVPSRGSLLESFSVGSRRYSYDPSGSSTGYHVGQAHGSPIQDGIHVRIADVDGEIARLELGDSETTRLPTRGLDRIASSASGQQEPTRPGTTVIFAVVCIAVLGNAVFFVLALRELTEEGKANKAGILLWSRGMIREHFTPRGQRLIWIARLFAVLGIGGLVVWSILA